MSTKEERTKNTNGCSAEEEEEYLTYLFTFLNKTNIIVNKIF